MCAPWRNGFASRPIKTTRQKGTYGMANKVNPPKAYADGEKILKVWKDNPDFKMGDVTLTKYTAAVGNLGKTIGDIDDKEDELKTLTNSRDDQARILCEWNTRARSGIRSVFGLDSTEYEKAGGTRKSDRKKAVRKPGTDAKKAA